MTSALLIQKPRKITVPLTEGLCWTGGGNMLYLRKYDGRWQEGGLPFGNHVLIVERMNDWYAAHSLAVLDGENVLGQSTRTRWRELCRLADDFKSDSRNIRLAQSGNGGEFVSAVIDNGGEGVCAFDLDAPWGEMWATKRTETFIVTVLEKHSGGKSSVRVGGSEGQDLGWCPLFGNKFDQVRVGSVLKLNGYGLTAAGRIREPRLDADSETSWLVKW